MFLKGVTSSTKKTFLSRLLLQPAGQRAFSRSSVQAFVNATEATQAAETADLGSFHKQEWEKLQVLSKAHLRKQKDQEAAEAEWLSQLCSPQQKEGIFAQISQINDGDHEHILEVKNRIARLVRQELDALHFEEKLKQEQKERLA